VNLLDEGSMKKILSTMIEQGIIETIPSKAYLKVMGNCFNNADGNSLSKNLRSKRCKLSKNSISDIIESITR
jgi:hypothetical protein